MVPHNQNTGQTVHLGDLTGKHTFKENKNAPGLFWPIDAQLVRYYRREKAVQLLTEGKISFHTDFFVLNPENLMIS